MTVLNDGQALPQVSATAASALTCALSEQARRVKAPMGPKSVGQAAALIYQRGLGCNVWDSDGNRYVDLCAGFGSLLLGHAHPALLAALSTQAAELTLALGDVFDSEPKLRLLSRLAELLPGSSAQGILGLSGADAVTCAIKTAVLATGRSELVAFHGSYHGLSYAPLAVSGLRDSYRSPFAAQLNPHVHWLPFPDDPNALTELEATLSKGNVAAVLLEPIQGRGGVRVPDGETLSRLQQMTRQHGTLLIADEIWTGLGRSGAWLWSRQQGIEPDIVCLGKGLGGGLPVSVCLGSAGVMACWSRDQEVVHTSTHAGAPLGAACALATLATLEALGLVSRAQTLGARWKDELSRALASLPVQVRGEGLMLAVDLGARPRAASRVMSELLASGFIVSTGGATRDTVVLTPPLIVEPVLLEAFTAALPPIIERVLAS